LPAGDESASAGGALANARHNFVTNVADVSLYGFAMNLTSVSVVLPTFVLALGGSPLAIAFVSGAVTLGLALPQLPAALLVRGRARVMPVLVVTGALQRLPWLVIAVAAWALPAGDGRLLPVVLGGVAAFALVTGAAKPAWTVLIAKVIPAERRGRFRSAILFWASLLGLGAGVIVGAVLEGGLAFPRNYALLFALSGAITLVSYGFALRNREPAAEAEVMAATATRAGWVGATADARGLLWRDVRLRRFVVVQILSLSSTMGAAFLAVEAVARFPETRGLTGVLVLATALGSIAAALVLGRLADRRGHRPNLLLGNLLQLFAMGLILTAVHPAMAVAAAFALAGALGAYAISAENVLLRIAPLARLPLYVGLANTVCAPFIAGYMVLGAWLAGLAGGGGAGWVFAATALCQLVSALVLWRSRSLAGV
jgi:MFS family permease